MWHLCVYSLRYLTEISENEKEGKGASSSDEEIEKPEKEQEDLVPLLRRFVYLLGSMFHIVT